ncbi:MAG TPA: type IV pilus secretin PilQ, partial [Kofleriaceae bacterium]|nr:type IV pilus secretin PilQ [Kofleriaceae bacterium]
TRAPAPAPAASAATSAATSPAASASAAIAARISGIRFQPDGDDQTVTVTLDGHGASAELVRGGPGHTELLVHGATLPADQARTLDATRFGGPVKTISSYTDPAGTVRVAIAHDGPAPRLDVASGTVRLRFAGTPAVAGVTTQTLPSPVVGGFGATSAPITQTTVAQLNPNRKVYRGATIDLDFKDADIHDLLRTLATVGRVNIVVPDEVRATVTVQLKRVPWDQALEVILESKGLWYRKEGNLYRIADRKTLDAEDEAKAARIKAMVELEHPEPQVYTLNYASAADLAAKLNTMGILSPKGKIEVDDRTNALIINDVLRNRQDVIDLAHKLDIQTPQISIEARIVEASSNFSREIGIQWGGRALTGAAGGNATGLVFPSSIGVTGGADSTQIPSGGVAAPSDFAVNLPTTLTGGAIGLSLGSVGGNFDINLRLTAMEQQGVVRIISAPKVTVLNNVGAHMGQGIRVPVQTTSAQGTQTQYIEASLGLDVTPYVSQADCTIVMDVKLAKDEFNFARVGARGDPTIETRTANTRLLVNDGETSVMGGIYTRNTGVTYNKIPLLGDLPVFGWLFKNRLETDTRGELLIFITPKITNRANLHCGAQ